MNTNLKLFGKCACDARYVIAMSIFVRKEIVLGIQFNN